MADPIYYPAHVFEEDEDDEPSVDVVIEHFERKLAVLLDREQHSHLTACGWW